MKKKKSSLSRDIDEFKGLWDTEHEYTVHLVPGHKYEAFRFRQI